jgi:hypothetical protein
MTTRERFVKACQNTIRAGNGLTKACQEGDDANIAKAGERLQGAIIKQNRALRVLDASEGHPWPDWMDAYCGREAA